MSGPKPMRRAPKLLDRARRALAMSSLTSPHAAAVSQRRSTSNAVVASEVVTAAPALFDAQDSGEGPGGSGVSLGPDALAERLRQERGDHQRRRSGAGGRELSAQGRMA